MSPVSCGVSAHFIPVSLGLALKLLWAWRGSWLGRRARISTWALFTPPHKPPFPVLAPILED